jgi:hypothetical protein
MNWVQLTLLPKLAAAPAVPRRKREAPPDVYQHNAEYNCAAAPALRIRDYDELGDPEPTEVTKPMAKRAVFMRTQFFGNDLCGVFRDPETDRVYAVNTNHLERA